MSIQALNWALNQDHIDNAGAKFVLLILCNYADENGQCWPSRDNIAEKTAMSVRSVQNHINWLAEKGYIQWKNEHTKANRQTPNIYQLPSAEFAPRTQKPSAKIAKAECKKRKKPSAESAQNTSEEDTSKNTILLLFDFWKKTFTLNGQTILTPKRQKVISDRLKQGYNVERIKNAILGNSISPFHCGQNDRGEKYHDIELICRSGEKVERFEEIWKSKPEIKPVDENIAKGMARIKAQKEMSYVPR